MSGGMLPQAARDLAQTLANRGIPAFPIGLSWNHEKRSVDKEPLSSPIAKNGVYDASTDPQRVEEMFLKARLGPRQEWGVGVFPGPAGYIVLDVDVKNDATGPEDLARLAKELGPLPKAMRVDTASGGWHLWLKRPSKPKNIGNINLAPGIGIRCDKGYVVAPGTTSPWGAWIRDSNTPRLTEVEQLPDAWAQRLNGRGPTGTKEPIPEKLTVGSRHDALVRMAGAMRRVGANAEEILAALQVMNETRCEPPHSDKKLEEIATDIESRYEPEADWKRWVATSPTSNGSTVADLLEESLEPIRWVVQELIPEGLTFLAGKTKIGKSWLTYLIALAVCSGQEVIGKRTHGGETLLIALEDGKRRLQDRALALGATKLGNHLRRFHYRTEWPTFNRGALDKLEQWMTDHPETRLIVIDTWGRIRGALPGKDHYSEEYALLGTLQSFATRHRIAVLLVHHLRKQGADDWIEQLSGSQAVTGAADTILGLYRERGQMDATLRTVSRDAEELELALRFENDSRWVFMGNAADYRHTVERTAVLEALRDLGGEAKVKDVAELIGKLPGTTSKLLLGLEKEGAVRKTRYGVYSLTSTVEAVEVIEPTSTTSTTSTRRDYEVFDLEAAEAHLIAAGLMFEEVP